MTEVGFWRTEIWHSLSVHFPIALLLASTLAMLISLILKAEKRGPWQNTATGLLFAGCLTAWISIYTGNEADGIVARKICDPTVLKDHEIAAQTTTYLFTLATVLSLMLLSNFLKPKVRAIFPFLILLLMLAGSVFLIQTGHLGARLVYQQGAGVDNHTVDCDE